MASADLLNGGLQASSHHYIFIISQLWLTFHPRSTVVLLDTETPGTVTVRMPMSSRPIIGKPHRVGIFVTGLPAHELNRINQKLEYVTKRIHSLK